MQAKSPDQAIGCNFPAVICDRNIKRDELIIIILRRYDISKLKLFWLVYVMWKTQATYVNRKEDKYKVWFVSFEGPNWKFV